MITIPADYPFPHSVGHELDVVATMLALPYLFDEYPHLTAEHFHSTRANAVFTVAKAIRERVQTADFDFTTLIEEANEKGLLTKMGGQVGLREISERGLFLDYMPTHIEKLNQYLAKRLAITAGVELVRSAFEDEFEDMLERAGAPITAIHDAVTAARPALTMKRIIGESFAGYRERLEGKATPMGIPTLDEIDVLIRGMHPGRIYIIGAYSGGGKSVLSSQIITYSALEHGTRCLEVNYEMVEKDSMDRKLIQMSGVPSQAFMDPLQYARDNDCPPINVEFMRKLERVKDALLQAPLFIRKPQNTQLRTLLALIRKHVREHDVKVVAIDYLQRIRHKSHSPEGEITEISHALQELAGELGIAILLLSQLNEKGDTKHGIVAIEDCDAYLIIQQDRDKESETFGQHYDILLAKDRHCGNSGKSIPLIFDKRAVKFKHGSIPRPKKASSKGPQKRS